VLKTIVDEYMHKVPQVRGYCQRCLATERWGGSVVLMVVDAAFTSIGLNYFQAVVPKVKLFKELFVEKRDIKTLERLAKANMEELKTVWKNERSWKVAKGVAAYLAKLKKKRIDDRKALRLWARNAKPESWWKDPIGEIKGVGINTFQYLRMMGGIDTVMPDKIVKRVINGILIKAGEKPVEDDIAFIKVVHDIALKTGYRAIELCWMTWLVQYGDERIKKYIEVLGEI
jgi:hypothetical protein